MSDPTYPTATSAAELVGGGGATYAVASQINPASPEGTSTVQPGERGGGPRGDGMRVPPGGTLPDGTVPDGTPPEGTAADGTASDAAEPSTAPEGTT